MASFPGSKVHRVARLKLGRGQHTQVPAAVITPAFGSTTLTMTFNVPVVVSGQVPVTQTGGTNQFVSQAVVSPTVVTQIWSSAWSTSMTVAMAANPATVVTNQGGGVAAFSTLG
jgi:hypothetical protein